jgi:HAD superfamily hydrolase (TIGR01509 family)
VRAVLFDLDDTLFDHSAASREALLEVAAAGVLDGVDPERLIREFALHNATCWTLAAAGELPLDDLRVERFRRTLAALGLAGVDQAAVSGLYLTAYAARSPAEVPGARALVHRLLARGPVGIVTNGFPDLVEGKLRTLGLFGVVDPVLVADRIELMKPRPHAFAAAVERLRLPPQDVLFVGDSLSADVGGARAAGLRPCWFDRHATGLPDGAPVPEFVVRRLEEVAAVVAGGAEGRRIGDAAAAGSRTAREGAAAARPARRTDPPSPPT